MLVQIDTPSSKNFLLVSLIVLQLRLLMFLISFPLLHSGAHTRLRFVRSMYTVVERSQESRAWYGVLKGLPVCFEIPFFVPLPFLYLFLFVTFNSLSAQQYPTLMVIGLVFP